MDAPEDCLDADGVLDVDGVDVSDGFNLVVGAAVRRRTQHAQNVFMLPLRIPGCTRVSRCAA